MTHLLILVFLGWAVLPAADQGGNDDAYGRFELLAPADGSFRVTYDVTVTQAGAKTFVSPLAHNVTSPPGTVGREIDL